MLEFSLNQFACFLNVSLDLVVKIDSFVAKNTLSGTPSAKYLTVSVPFLAVGQAHGAFYLRLASTLRKRRKLRRSPTRNPNMKGWWRKSVIVAYFLQGHARARDLKLPGVH